MAVTKMPDSCALTIKVQTGVSDTGKPIYRLRTYNNVKTDATDAAIYAVGNGLAGLQINPVNAIMRVDKCSLINEA